MRFNILMGTGNYSATSSIVKLVHWPLMDGLLHLVQQSAQTPPHCSKCNSPPINGQCTNHRIAVSWTSGPLLCGFNMPIKGLKNKAVSGWHVVDVLFCVTRSSTFLPVVHVETEICRVVSCVFCFAESACLKPLQFGEPCLRVSSLYRGPYREDVLTCFRWKINDVWNTKRCCV